MREREDTKQLESRLPRSSTGPVHGPLLGPEGPIDRQQQRIPPQHPFNRLFPPRGNQRLGLPAAVLGLAFALARLWAPAASANSETHTADDAGLSAPESLDSDALPRSSSAISLARSSSVFSIDFQRVTPTEIEEDGSDESARNSTAFSFGCPPSVDPVGLDGSTPPTPDFRSIRPLQQVGRAPAPQGTRRHSARLAAKSAVRGGAHQDSTAVAVRRKALLNSLSGCSSTLKKHVNKNNLLSRSKLPLCASEIRKLLDAAGVACSSATAVEVENPQI